MGTVELETEKTKLAGTSLAVNSVKGMPAML
jgi:hypothetical protein